MVVQARPGTQPESDDRLPGALECTASPTNHGGHFTEGT